MSTINKLIADNATTALLGALLMSVVLSLVITETTINYMFKRQRNTES